VAADLGLVAHAAERHAHELAPGRPAIDLPSEVLPTPGGPTRHRIGPFSFFGALLHGEILDDALLDLLEAVMILVEDLLRRVQMSFLTLVRFFHGIDSSQSR
jgi:hypothetical protein